MLSIRKAGPADAPLILSLIRELAEYEREPDAVAATEAGLADVLFGPSPRAFCEIAEWEGLPAGFCLWFYNFSTWRGAHGLYLEDLFVRPDFRGKGVGKAILSHLAARCVREKLARMEWAVLDWNALAIGVYRSVGAEILDEWRICRLTSDALQNLGNAAPT
jgi:GNAT superfamily N-acetyltransferase